MRKYSTEFKLEVVQSFLAGDGGAKLLARRWSLPEEKIRTWVSRHRIHAPKIGCVPQTHNEWVKRYRRARRHHHIRM